MNNEHAHSLSCSLLTFWKMHSNQNCKVEGVSKKKTLTFDFTHDCLIFHNEKIIKF